jgi:hypothetical protein
MSVVKQQQRRVMMNGREFVLKVFLLTVVAVTMAGCGGVNVNYVSDIAPEANFESYDTYAFRSVFRDPSINDTLYQFLSTTVEHEMDVKGYDRVDSAEASLDVAIFALISEEIDERAIGASYIEAFQEVREIGRGTLQINIRDAQTKEWIWKGRLEGVVQEDYPARTEESRERLTNGISKLMKDFPAK